MENLDSQTKVTSTITRKLDFVNPTPELFQILLKRLSLRLDEGRSEAIIELGTGEIVASGITPEELSASEATLHDLANELKADVERLRIRTQEQGQVGEYLVRRRPILEDFMEIRVAVVGNVDAGKSTLLGVLTHAELDNGRGLARQKLFRYKHEMESGRTSSVGNDILGFDSRGRIVNQPIHGTQLDWVRICEQSAKVITFIDLAGHEKYLKTTVFGMTGHAPDFAMLMVGANAGIIGMTKEHLSLSLALNVPVFVVVTKIDMCPANVLDDTMKLLCKILKSPGCRKMPVVVSNHDQVVFTACNFTSERVCPIFKVSNVTGENLDLLKDFLNLLSVRGDPGLSDPAEFQIDDTFSVPGVGTVVSGTCLRGIIKLNDQLLLGPDTLGHFVPIPIRSIHRKRMHVKEVRGSQTASFSLKRIRRNQIRKGMVVVSPELNPRACWEFQADILILHHPTTISVKYQAMVHVGPIRQTATIISMDCEHMRTGDKASVRFRFLKNPEYLRRGVRMVFREGKTKAVGTITEAYPHIVAIAQNTRQRNLKNADPCLEGTLTAACGNVRNHENVPQKASKRGRSTDTLINGLCQELKINDMEADISVVTET